MTPLETWLLLDSSGMGGIESHVAELAAGLRDAGESPRVLFLRDHGPHPLRGRLDADEIPWEALAGGFLPLVRRLRKGMPRILHTHGYKANLLGRAAACLLGIPCAATFHAGETPAGRVALYDKADRWTSFACGARLAVSRPILARLPFRSTLAPNFVLVPPPPPGGFVPPDSVAFVGRMSREKGPDLFIDLAAASRGPRYLAYGDGPEMSGIRLASHGTGVELMGAVASMEGHWKEVGLLAVTSRAEGLPLAALEAMARGVSVASFAVGGLPDLVEDGVSGFLVPPGDVEAMAAVVRRWRGMEPASRTAMAGAARDRVAREFGRAAGVGRIRAAYLAAGA